MNLENKTVRTECLTISYNREDVINQDYSDIRDIFCPIYIVNSYSINFLEA